MNLTIPLSVVIPTYIKDCRDIDNLMRCLESFLEQEIWPSEIIITDDSSDKLNLDVLEFYVSKFKGKLKYINNPDRLGLSQNYNKAISLCSGKWILLFAQDDYLINANSLREIYSNIILQPMKNWFLIANNSPSLEIWVPEINIKNLLGFNNIGGLSSLVIPSTKEIVLDKELTQLVDCDLFWRLNSVLGGPGLIYKPLIGVGLGWHQTSMNIEFEKVSAEITYLVKKHNIPRTKIFLIYLRNIDLPHAKCLLHSQFNIIYRILIAYESIKNIIRRAVSKVI